MVSKQRRIIAARLPFHRVAALWLTTLAGCSTWGMPKSMPWPLSSDDSPQTPTQIVALWTEAVQHQANLPPVRGFGARVMFYDGKNEKPIKVEGTLVVYGFDESGRDPNSTKPDRKFVYLPDKLPSHYSKSKLGHSYSVWVPWDKVGGLRKEITLIVRFLPKDGAPVVCDSVRQVLSGDAPSNGPTQASYVPGAAPGRTPSGFPPAQLPSYDQITPIAAAPPADYAAWQRRMLTTSIPIRSGLAMGPSPSPSPAYPTPQSAPAQGGFFYGQPYTAAPAASWYPPPGGVAMPPQAVQPSAPAATGWSPPRTRYTPPRSQALGEPIARLNRDRGPSPAGSPSAAVLPPGTAPEYGSLAPPVGSAPTAY